jgi:hypothetical protein
VYQSITGDAVLVARVVSIATPPSDPGEKAGVMLRDGLTPGAANVFLYSTPTVSNGYGWQVRAAAGATTATAAVPLAACGSGIPPVWAKIVRSGNSFTAFCSASGSTWYPVGSAVIAMSSTIQVGLAVTGHTSAPGALATATFDGISLGAAGGTTPYAGSPINLGAIQGQWYRVEAEDYDLGGNGIAYWDTTLGNAGGKYRTDDVDVEAACGGSSCYDVFQIAPGEWTKYTVNATAGTYKVQLGVSSSGTSHMHISDANSANLTGPLTLASTGSLSTFQVQSPTATFALSAGPQILQFVFDDGSMDLNWVQFERQ